VLNRKKQRIDEYILLKSKRALTGEKGYGGKIEDGL
jgi:hypothetical protein